MELINKILDLPIIVQGALGSALFWLFLESGQRFLRLCSKVSANITDHKNTALYIALGSVAHDSLERRKFLFQGMVHGVLHYFIKAMIFIVLGLSCQSFIPVLGFVGYFGINGVRVFDLIGINGVKINGVRVFDLIENIITIKVKLKFIK